MSDETKTGSWKSLGWTWLLLLLLYPLSAGPMQRVAKPWGAIYGTIYSPLFRLVDCNQPAKAVLIRWLQLWEVPDRGRRCAFRAVLNSRAKPQLSSRMRHHCWAPLVRRDSFHQLSETRNTHGFDRESSCAALRNCWPNKSASSMNLAMLQLLSCGSGQGCRDAPSLE